MDRYNCMPNYIPRIGLEFDSEDEAFAFYTNYGGHIGFSTRKEYFNKCKKTKIITSRKFTCSKEGFRAPDKRDGMVKNSRSETRTGCGAHMTISFKRSTNKYEVYSFDAIHNHDLHIKECFHMMPSQRKVTEAQATMIELADASGIKVRSSYELASRQAGGREFLGFTRADLKNYLWTVRQKKLEFGEAGALLNYFEEQSLLDPSFHYTMQLDIDEQITNIFWADAKMIIDYGQFGDMVSFDTTYRTNKSSRPLGVFVGFNNYRQTVIFGAALMYDETTASFKWLFESFLKAMYGKKPKTIFTDQDHAMAQAISLVMPETFHRICIWHMMQNAIKHLGHLFKREDEDKSGIKTDLKSFIYYYETEDEFNSAWEAMLTNYDNLRDNRWLKSIYEARNKWGKPYVRLAWSAWADTTQISESFNAKIRQYLPTDLGILNFFHHFERVVDDTQYKELECEYSSRQKLPKVGLLVPMMIQAGKFYTHTIFELFKEQYSKSLWSTATRHNESNLTRVYNIQVPNEVKCREVTCSPEGLEISCTCRLFENSGILCAHALKALDMMNIKEIPQSYLLKRWAKKAKEGMVQLVDRSVSTQVGTNLEVTSRYRTLVPNLIKLGCRAAENPKTYNMVSQLLVEISKKVEDILNPQCDASQQDQTGDSFDNQMADNNNKESEIHENNEKENQSPNIEFIRSKGLKKKTGVKGRPKNRMKSWVEMQNKTKKRKSKPSQLQNDPTASQPHSDPTASRLHSDPTVSQVHSYPTAFIASTRAVAATTNTQNILEQSQPYGQCERPTTPSTMSWMGYEIPRSMSSLMTLPHFPNISSATDGHKN